MDYFKALIVKKNIKFKNKKSKFVLNILYLRKIFHVAVNLPYKFS